MAQRKVCFQTVLQLGQNIYIFYISRRKFRTCQSNVNTTINNFLWRAAVTTERIVFMRFPLYGNFNSPGRQNFSLTALTTHQDNISLLQLYIACFCSSHRCGKFPIYIFDRLPQCMYLCIHLSFTLLLASYWSKSCLFCRVVPLSYHRSGLPNQWQIR